MTAPFDIIVPVRNEAIALAFTAPALARSLDGLCARVIYVLNATTDQSASVIRKAFGSRAVIVELPEAGKTLALSAGDAAAQYGTRVYLDADVTVAADIFQKLLAPLRDGTADLVSPRIQVEFGRAGPLARRVGRVWADQMARRPDAFMCCTVLSPKGIEIRGPWPDILSDDDWQRDRINPARRMVVETASINIIAPSNLLGWLTVRARWIRGRKELEHLNPEAPHAAWVQPRGTIPDLAAYYGVRLAAEPVAFVQERIGITWGRDHSSRRARNV